MSLATKRLRCAIPARGAGVTTLVKYRPVAPSSPPADRLCLETRGADEAYRAYKAYRADGADRAGRECDRRNDALYALHSLYALYPLSALSALSYGSGSALSATVAGVCDRARARYAALRFAYARGTSGNSITASSRIAIARS